MPAPHGLWEEPAPASVGETTESCYGCLVERMSGMYHHDFRIVWIDFPHFCHRNYSFLRQTPAYRRWASHLPHSSYHGIQPRPYFLVPQTPGRSDSAASTVADATFVAGTTADASRSPYQRSVERYRCESWREPQPVHWPINWRAWVQRAGCLSSSELRSTVRGWPPWR
jgi:hypothetical protein